MPPAVSLSATNESTLFLNNIHFLVFGKQGMPARASLLFVPLRGKKKHAIQKKIAIFAPSIPHGIDRFICC